MNAAIALDPSNVSANHVSNQKTGASNSQNINGREGGLGLNKFKGVWGGRG